jgi:hypothetical protein
MQDLLNDLLAIETKIEDTKFITIVCLMYQDFVRSLCIYS